jgi:hypothetical protein
VPSLASLRWSRVKPPTSPRHKREREREGFTAWGKAVGGLQAGLGYLPGQHRTYYHGETVKLVVRVRNVGKEAVEFKHIWAFFFENPPAITDAGGKRVPLPRGAALGLHMPRSPNVAPGKEVDLFDWEFDLRPNGGSSQKLFAIHGTGKFSLQCERIVGPTSSNPNHPNPTLSKLATGKLELEIKPAPPPAGGADKKTELDTEKTDFPRPGTKSESGKRVTIRVYIEKVNADSRAITASCVTLGEIDGAFKPLQLENLSVSKFARIQRNGKEMALADLKPGTGARLDLDARELTLTVVGMEVLDDRRPPGATEKK